MDKEQYLKEIRRRNSAREVQRQLDITYPPTPILSGIKMPNSKVSFMGGATACRSLVVSGIRATCT